MKALFVCTGNSCRSVMAEYLFNQAAKTPGLEGWEARSCGIAAERSFPTPPGVRKALAARGIAEVRHTPQLVTRTLLGWADAVYAMARNHKDALWDHFPEFRGKISLFLEGAGLGAGDVEDPIGRPDETYLACCEEIEQGIQGLLRNHATENTKPRS